MAPSTRGLFVIFLYHPTRDFRGGVAVFLTAMRTYYLHTTNAWGLSLFRRRRFLKNDVLIAARTFNEEI